MTSTNDSTKPILPETNGATRSHATHGMVQVQPPRREDLQPSYAQFLENDDVSAHGWYGAMVTTLGQCIGTFGAIPCCICCPNPYRSVNQGQVGLITKFGRFYRAVDPGLIKVNPLSEKLIQVDVKIQIVEVPKQICMTRDNVSLELTSVIYYQIVSPHKACFGISNIRQALIERTQPTLRHVVGARVLQDVIERREELAQSIGDIIDEVASGWGVRVESMLIKDLVFSRELQDSLSLAAQSKRRGEATIVIARAEVESAKLMRQAADILSSPAAMQIRSLEANIAIAKSAGSKVIFLPAPTQSMQSVFTSSDGTASSGGEIGESSSTAARRYDERQQDPLQQAITSKIMENI